MPPFDGVAAVQSCMFESDINHYDVQFLKTDPLVPDLIRTHSN